MHKEKKVVGCIIILTEARTKTVKKFKCCECVNSQRLTRFRLAAINPLSSDDEASNSSIPSPERLAGNILESQNTHNKTTETYAHSHKIKEKKIII